MTPDQAIPELEKLWDLDGYFGLLRQGRFEPTGTGAVERLLQSIDVSEEVAFPRRFVSMTWWIPTFMEWQVERVGEQGGDTEQLRRDIVRLRNALDTLLGVP